MTKHTPGPWRVRFLPPNDESFFVQANTYPGHPYHGVTSGMDVIGDEDYPTKLADAHLVSAAPDLLEAAKIALENLEASKEFFGTRSILRVAISKAEGR
jgi:hypothetical protein